MTIPVKRIGLSKVYEPDEAERATTDIVLVHGLFGHPYNTWTKRITSRDIDIVQESQVSAGSAQGAGSSENMQPNTADSTASAASEPQSKRLSMRNRVSGFFMVRSAGKKERSPAPDKIRGAASEASQGSRMGEVPVSKPGDPKKEKVVFWPRDLLPKLIKDINVYTWGYDADVENLTTPAGQLSIYQHARTLLSDLCDERISPSDQKRPIVFVAHSLGGIIVKDALAESRAEVTHLKEVFPAALGVCFLGTPHRGSDTASLGKLAFEISKVFFQKPNTSLLHSLEVNSENLERISHSFSIILSERKLVVHSFMEELRTRGMMVVPSFSYSIGDAFETTGVIHADHSQMPKFSSLEDEGFTRVYNVIRRMMQRAPSLQWLNQPTVVNSNVSLQGQNARGYFSEDEEKCLQSLDQPDARKRVDEVSESYPETLQWVFGDEVNFTEWLKARKSDIYWIQGKPASGKSTLMRFILKNESLETLLPTDHRSAWLKGGFFFHDRGSDVQRTVNGLLSEMLYSILSTKSILLSLIIPIWSKVTSLPGHRNVLGEATPWMTGHLCEALASIFSQNHTRMNVLFFIDAVDEHIGDHRELIHQLKTILQLANDHSHCLKLCLASRPENVFKAELGFFQGFAIHEHTTEDIRSYVNGKLQNEVVSSSNPSEFQLLADSVVEKAQGVFLWVELVVAELLDGANEGDSIKDLQELLFDLPDDLDQLYRRTMKRVLPVTSTKTARERKRAMETMTIFQLALCAKDTYTLETLVQACTLVVSSRPYNSSPGNGGPSEEMRRKIIARSGGLLEIIQNITREILVAGERRQSTDDYVQFIHQTAKEFVQRGYLEAALPPGLVEATIESGYVLTTRFHVRVLLNELSIDILDFFYYAHHAEDETRHSQMKELLPLLSGNMGINTLIQRLHESKMIKLRVWFILYWVKDPRIRLAVLLVDALMPITLIDLLQNQARGPWDNGALLLAAADRTIVETKFFSHVAQDWQDRWQSEAPNSDPKFNSVLATLLNAGLDPNSPCHPIGPYTSQAEHTTPLVSLIKDSRGGPQEVEAIRLLLQAGADPDRKDSTGNSARAYAEKNGDPVLLQAIEGR